MESKVASNRPRYEGKHEDLLKALKTVVNRVCWITYDEDKGAELDKPEIQRLAPLIRNLHSVFPSLTFKPSDVQCCLSSLRQDSVEAKTWALALKPEEVEDWEMSCTNRLMSMLRAFQQSRLKRVRWALDLLGDETTPVRHPGEPDRKRLRLRQKSPTPAASAAAPAAMAALAEAAPAEPAPRAEEVETAEGEEEEVAELPPDAFDQDYPNYIVGYSFDQERAWRKVDGTGKAQPDFTKDALKSHEISTLFKYILICRCRFQIRVCMAFDSSLGHPHSEGCRTD